MARARWAQWPLHGSPWVLKYPYCHQMITQTHPRGERRVSEKGNFGNLVGVTKQPTQRQFRGFWGGHGSGYMGLAATTWDPMGAQVPVLSLKDHPNPSQGRKEGFGKR